MTEIVSRETAKYYSLTRFFTGVPCKHGHLSQRMTSNKACITCLRLCRSATPEKRAKENRRRNKVKKSTPEKRAIRNRKERLRESQRIPRILRNRLNLAIRRGGSRAGSAVSDLGCTIGELKIYLASKFTEGMSWDNYGLWQIDHKIPLAVFDLSDRNQFLTACHFTNLQPLWAVDNQKKSSSFAKELLKEANVTYREVAP